MSGKLILEVNEPGEARRHTNRHVEIQTSNLNFSVRELSNCQPPNYFCYSVSVVYCNNAYLKTLHCIKRYKNIKIIKWKTCKLKRNINIYY